MKSTNFHLHLPWKHVGHSWEEDSIYDARGKVVCRFDLNDLGEVTEENQEEMEAKQKKRIQFILDVVNKEYEP